MNRVLLVLLFLMTAKGFAQATEVFTCDAAALYQTIRIEVDIPNVGSAGDMIFYQVNPNSGDFTFVSNLSIDDDGAANGDVAMIGRINSIGFNPIDGFIYGIEPNDDILYRISPNGFLENLGFITGALTNANGNVAGAFDQNGIYYIYGASGRLISLDLSSSPNLGDPLVSQLLYNIGKNASDIAINPVTSLIYGWDQSASRRHLFTINPANGNVNIIGPANATSPFSIFGALYFTAGGQLIGYGDDTTTGSNANSQETLVQFDLTTGVPNIISTGLSVGTNDGASCPYGFELFKDAPDSVELGNVFTYTFTISNATATALQDLNFIDNLMTGLQFVSEPYNTTNGITIIGLTNGLTSANLIISNVPTGSSTFQIDVVTDCSVDNMVISNQASLSSEFLTVVSDDPQTSGITNTTVTAVETPTITVPLPLELEGCNIEALTLENAVFPLNTETFSSDIKDIFNTIVGYTTSAPQNIVSITYIDTIVENSSCPITINREFTLTNTCNNISTLIQIINIQDLTSPTFTLPSDVTINCSEDPSNFTLTGDVIDENDNCSDNLQATFTDVINTDGFPDTCNSSYTILRTWSLIDDCNNVTQQLQTINVEDTTAPDITFCSLTDQVFECEGVLGNETLANNWNASNISALENCATDDCNTNFTGLITSDYNFSNFTKSCGQSGFINAIYTISDGCGNSMSLEPVTLTINDTIAPVLDNCGVENTILDCFDADNENSAIAWNNSNIATLEACSADACDLYLVGQVTSNFDFANLNTTCGPCGTLNVIYTVTDDCGNSSEINVTLTFNDGKLPDLSNCSVIDQTVECSFNDIETIGDNWNTSNISSLENCTQTFDITVTSDYNFNNIVQACGQTGSINVLYTLTDLCKNATLFEATFTIEDSIDPVFDGVDDDICIAEFINGSFEANTFDGTFVQFQQEDIPGWSTTASHNTIEIQRSGQIDGSIPFDGNYHFELNGQALDDLYQEFCTVPLSNLELSFYHKKRASSTTVDVLEVFIGPDLNNLTSQGLFQVSDAEGWKQNIITYAVPAGQDATIVLFQAISGTTNSVGNLLDAITVNSDANTNGPLPEDITVECNEIPDAPSLTASDNCGSANVTLIESIVPGSCTNQYTIVRTWTAADDCGNNISHTQNINVVDTTSPGFTTNPPLNTTVECGNLPNAPTLFADDNCGSATVTFEEVSASGDCLSVQTISRTWTATDECGNTNVHVQTITVQDTTAPTFTVPVDVSLECDADLTDVSITGDVNDEDDNCSSDLEATFTDTTADGSCVNETIITRIWTLTDECDNTTTAIQTITIEDTTAPTFTVPADVSLECDTDLADVSITGDVNDEADNCSTELEATFTDTTAGGPCVNETIITRTWSLTDECDNTTTAIQMITIEDTTAPTFTVPADVSLECDTDLADVLITGDVIDEADNCSTDLEATFTDVVADGSCANETIITRTWTLTDECDNTTIAIQTITLEDTTAPTFTVPADVSIECDLDVTDVSLTGDVTDEADNCSANLEATFVDTITNGDCANSSIITRVWTVTDDCDNATALVQTITIEDTTAPTFTIPESITIECDQDITDINTTGDVTDETDNCSTELEATFTDVITEGDCTNNFTITRTWSLTDDCDNTTTLIQTITVVDSTAPTLVGEFEDIIDIACSDIPEVPNLVFEDACSENMTVEFNETSTSDGSVSDYTIIRDWFVADECGNEAIFTQTINVTVATDINVDEEDLCIGEDFDFDLFDLLLGDYDPDGVWAVTSGIAAIDGSFFNPSSLLDAAGNYTDDQLSSYEFTYTYAGFCPGEVSVTITLNDECIVLPCGQDDLIISKAVTANFDGVNEFFTITGTETCGFVFELQIFNRWGAKIYDNSNYQNDWNATASSGSIGNSEFVPTGTYYYVLNIKNSGLRPVTGPIYVSTK
ncbi:gliding motility-associated C-terminal domain-containing protein [Psychroserpens sp.]|uniref:gliding motility-associated C-terminal domain-containing protein n=1 Tax=Psychroserpens sp. TaxID=2020870 RepID=UPI0039E49D64